MLKGRPSTVWLVWTIVLATVAGLATPLCFLLQMPRGGRETNGNRQLFTRRCNTIGEDFDGMVYNIEVIDRKRNRPKKKPNRLDNQRRRGNSPRDDSVERLARRWNKSLRHRLTATQPSMATVVAAEEELWDRVAASEPYDCVSFNIVLNAYAKQRSRAGAERADALLARQWEVDTTPDSYSYSSVLHAYAKADGTMGAAKKAEELLQQYEERCDTPLTTDILHNAVLDAWAACRNGPRAERFLHEHHPAPTTVAYVAVLRAYGKEPTLAEALLRSWLSDSKNQEIDKRAYTVVIHAYISSSCYEEADLLLSELEERFDRTKDERFRPDIYCYTAVVAGGSGRDVEFADWEQRMKRYDVTPTAPFVNAWIHSLRNKQKKTFRLSPPETRARQAEQALSFLKEQPKLHPCVITYTAVICMWADVGTKEAVHRAVELLDELQALWTQTGDRIFLPNAQTFASVLNAVGKRSDGLALTDQLLARMKALYRKTGAESLRPNLIVFSQIFQILANSDDPMAPIRAKELLKEMKKLDRKGLSNVRPDARTYAYLINTFTKSDVENTVELATRVLEEVEDGYAAGIGELRPTELLYSAVLQAYAKSWSKEGTVLAQNLLHRMKRQYRSGKVYAKPTTLHYNAVMDALARCDGGREAAEQAEELLNEMDGRSLAGDPTLKPNTRSFNAAILCWKNSNDSRSPERAESLLRSLNNRFRNGDRACCPCRVTINSVIAVWAKSSRPNAADRAHSFLNLLLNAACTTKVTLSGVEMSVKNESLMPDCITFNSCISAYARSGRKDACERAQALFDQLLCLYDHTGDERLKPDRRTIGALRSARYTGKRNLAEVSLTNDEVSEAKSLSDSVDL